MKGFCLIFLAFLLCLPESFAGGLDVGNGGRSLYCETQARLEHAKILDNAGRALDDAFEDTDPELISAAYDKFIEAQRLYYINAQFFDLWYAQEKLKLNVQSIQCRSPFYIHMVNFLHGVDTNDCELGSFKKLVGLFISIWPEYKDVFLREYKFMSTELLYFFETQSFIRLMSEQQSVNSPFTLPTNEYSQFSVDNFICRKDTLPRFSATGVLYYKYWLVDWRIYLAYTPTHRAAFYLHEWVVRVLRVQNKEVNIDDVIKLTAYLFSGQQDPEFLKKEFSRIW